MILGRAFPLHLLEESLLPADSGLTWQSKKTSQASMGFRGLVIGFMGAYMGL